MATYAVYYAQYSRGQHFKGDKSRHMEIVVETANDGTTETGTAYHITGTSAFWTYEVVPNVHYQRTSFCGRLLLGTIPATGTALRSLQQLLGTLTLRHNDASFNCQRWVWEAALFMRESGYRVDPVARFPDFLAKMHEAFDAWD
ncbi:hypothetical protein FOMPIDRAFT_1019954 [Fomitopsis schrenkii]|uniref:PPPDE domain-containing protein n=1 Tax=Fomitopsis schrenkii TaxID=2126942 RepID=S8DTJ3_FOMSC|nr:hypothetical protein FOMPIDRAFT_1019954 [Fomitopsis schrenkii]